MNILVFGHSITHGAWDIEFGGWVNRLKIYLDKRSINSKFEEYFSVYNLGISGGDTRTLLERFENEIKPRFFVDEDHVIIIQIGTNDTIWDNVKQEFRISPNKYKENIGKLIEKARKYTGRIFIVNSSPVIDSKLDPIPWLSGSSYNDKHIQRYNEILKETCDKEHISLIDIYTDFDKESLDDGVHPNSQGHEFIFKCVKTKLEEEKLI